MPKRIKITSIIIGSALLVLVLSIGASGIGTCNLFTGECNYEPGKQSPSPLFMAQHPEPFIVQYIQKQAKQNGTFPVSATDDIVSITPTHVHAGGFYTDWHVQVRMQVKITYADGTARTLEFETLEKSAETLLGIENTTMFVGFGPLSDCEQDDPGFWQCR
jgi:hypothetical protein